MELSVQNEEEMEAIRAVMQDEGVLLSVFDVLRRVPRRVLMVLKLNDLTRWVRGSGFVDSLLRAASLVLGVWITP